MKRAALVGSEQADDGARPNLSGISGVLNGATLKELVALAWPIATAMIGETAMGLVDTKLVGGRGAAALGGVGVATSLMYLCYAALYGFMRGVKVRTAYAVGRGTPEDGARYAQAGATIALVVGLFVWALGRDVTWVLAHLDIDAALIPYARDFFSAITWGAPGAFVVNALVQHRQGRGDAQTPMVIGIAGNVVNAVLAYALIYGKLGLPELGVRGAGYATAFVQTTQAFVLVGLLVREGRRAERSRLGLRDAWREVTTLGLPTGAQFGAEMLAMTTFTAILGSLGASEIAAHQVALAVIRTSFLPGVAVGEAASILVGQSLGRRDLAEADRVTRAALVVACGFMAVCGIVFAVAGGNIGRAFASEPEVARRVQHLLWVAAVFQVLDAINIVLRGALRGAKDVRWAAIIGICVVWTCVPGSAFVLGKLLGWGAIGGWCGFLLETIFASTLFWLRWTRGSWRRDHAPKEENAVLALAV